MMLKHLFAIIERKLIIDVTIHERIMHVVVKVKHMASTYNGSRLLQVVTFDFNGRV